MSELNKKEIQQTQNETPLTPYEQEDDKSVRSFPIWRILYRNLLLIILSIIIFAGGVAVYGKYTSKPTYTASCSVLLGISLDYESTETDKATDISLSKLYLPSIMQVMQSPVVIKRANDMYSDAGYISLNSISVKRVVDNSLIFSVSYTDYDKELAIKKLKTFVAAGAQELEENGEKYVPANEFILTETQKEFVITTQTGVMYYAVVGAAIGLILSVLYAILKYLLDNKVKSEAELEEITQARLLAYIDKSN